MRELTIALAGAAVAVAFLGIVLYSLAPPERRAVEFLTEGQRRRGRFDLGAALEATPLGRRVAADLAGAGMGTRPASFLALLGTILVVGVFVFPAMLGDVGYLVALAAAAIPYVVVRQRAGQHTREFKRQLPAVLDLIANALRAGQSETQAFALVATETPGAAGAEFRRMREQLELGATVDAVTQALLERLPDPELELVVDAIQLAHRVGGNLAQMLADIAGTIRERTRIELEVRSLTAQSRASVWLVTALAPLGLIAVSFLNPEWGQLLFQTTPGRILLLAAATLVLVGYLAASRAAVVEV